MVIVASQLKKIKKLYNVTLVICGFTLPAISDTNYENLKTDPDPWFCLVCSLKYNLNNVPFTRCSNSDLININNLKVFEKLLTLKK